jgi:hypothetical protein
MAIKPAILDVGPTVQRANVPVTIVPVVSQWDPIAEEGYVLDGSPSRLNFSGPTNTIWVLTDFTPTEEGRLLCSSTRNTDGTFTLKLYCTVDTGSSLEWKRVALFSGAINIDTGKTFDTLSLLPGPSAG